MELGNNIVSNLKDLIRDTLKEVLRNLGRFRRTLMLNDYPQALFYI